MLNTLHVSTTPPLLLLLLRHPPLTRTNSHTLLILSPPSLSPKKMADRNSGTVQLQRQPRPNSAQAAFLRQLHEHAPNSGQLFGFLTLVISSAILLFFTGLTITATVLGLIFFTPLILISSPIWVPVGTVLFIAISGFLSVCGFGMGTVAAMSWIYRYYRGLHPVGSDRVDYARSRIADTASHVKDYAREYGGYLHGKVKDAAPGA